MKGIVTAVLGKLGFNASRVHIKENTCDKVHFHPYRSAEVWLDKTRLGVFGEVHPEYAAKFDLKRIVYAELRLGPVLTARTSKVRFNALDRYPAVTRDIAIVVKKNVTGDEILNTVRKAGKKIMRNSEIFDIYEGEHVGADEKSVALRITYQADHTLKDEEITSAHEEILTQLKNKLKAQLRA